MYFYITTRFHCIGLRLQTFGFMEPFYLRSFAHMFRYCTYTKDGTKEIPPFFLRKCFCNNSEIYVYDSDILFNYEAIFPKIISHFQNTFANVD
jgi:hypothetical protein